MRLIRDKFARMSYLHLDGADVIPDFDDDGNIIGLELFGVPTILDYLEPDDTVEELDEDILIAVREAQFATIQ